MGEEKLFETLRREFDKLFSNSNKSNLFFAPGRINLIGEHTDYTGGFVLPAGINNGTYILAKKNNSKKINISSVNFNSKVETIVLDNKLEKENNWADYIKGVLFFLNEKFGKLEQGFDAIVFGNIPNGAGLSSSASIEMAAILTILGMNDLPIPLPGSKEMIDMTLLAQKAENSFVGVNCGIMDQFAIGNAKKNSLIKLDCSNLNFEYCEIYLDKYSILVSNTNKKRRLEESQYNKRREECETGFDILRKNGLYKEFLGHVTLDEWNCFKHLFDNRPIIQKRLNHVIFENNRVKQAFNALKD